ncbi:acetyl-CoA carboxylase biotin carboxylase subunit family protein [Streptomyces sp. NPDC059340]|uniref:ATP-grasp domain-containing protein n=1 Tax=Streptomyces sp. NPDC059340 TaxID=3346806 RepID=UPI0036A7AD6C
MDPSDIATVTAAATSYGAKHDINGVLTYTQDHLEVAARTARKLELPGIPVEALTTAADHVALRRQLAQHKVPVSRWAESRTPEAAATHADLIGYPIVIRSRGGDVAAQARTRGEVAAIYKYVHHKAKQQQLHADPSQMVVEESAQGPFVCAETVVLNSDDIRIVAITRTTLGPPPARQAVRHCVYAHDPLLHNPFIRHTVERTVRALGITLGVLHIKMLLTSRGPHFTDIKAHLASDMIPLLVKRATGIDLPQVAAALATGSPPELTPSRQRAAAVHFAYPAVTGRVEQLAITAPIQQPLVDHIVLTQHLGQQVTAAPYACLQDRLAHWVVRGPNAAACHTLLDQTARHVSIGIGTPVAATGHAS